MKRIVAKKKIRYPMALEREYSKQIVSCVDDMFKTIRSRIPAMVKLIKKHNLQGMQARFFNMYGDTIEYNDMIEYNLDNCMSFADMEVKGIRINFPLNRVDFTVKYFKTEVK
jgi:hypothetical protein